MRLSAAILLVLCLAGCAWSPTTQERKKLVQQKHAENEAFAERVKDEDPAKRPSPAQMQVWIIMNSKDWESLDRLENHWQPTERYLRVPAIPGAPNGH